MAPKAAPSARSSAPRAAKAVPSAAASAVSRPSKTGQTATKARGAASAPTAKARKAAGAGTASRAKPATLATTKAAAAKAVAQASGSEASDSEAEDAQEDEVAAAAAAMFSDSDSDSDGEDAPLAIHEDVADDPRLQKGIAKAQASSGDAVGVVVLSRIPFGFFEDAMRKFFKQFGDITRLRLARNPKTGRSRHYAFIEFKNAEVARIVAETMDNYLMFGRMLKCKYVPPDQVHPNTFIGANRRMRPKHLRLKAREQHNKARTAEKQEAHTKRLLSKEKAKRTLLKEHGIEYDFPGYAAAAKKAGASV